MTFEAEVLTHYTYGLTTVIHAWPDQMEDSLQMGTPKNGTWSIELESCLVPK